MTGFYEGFHPQNIEIIIGFRILFIMVSLIPKWGGGGGVEGVRTKDGWESGGSDKAP